MTKFRLFLGLAFYYRKIVPDFAVIAHPLLMLMKIDVPFDFTFQYVIILSKSYLCRLLFSHIPDLVQMKSSFLKLMLVMKALGVVSGNTKITKCIQLNMLQDVWTSTNENVEYQN